MNSIQFQTFSQPPLDSLEPRFFIPICLYPHTGYRTREGLTKLIERFGLDICDHMIVVADHLLALDNLVTGRFWNPDRVFERAHRQGAEIFRLIRKTARIQKSQEKMVLNYWDDVAKTENFQDFSARITFACLACSGFNSVIKNFVQRRIDRFVLGDAGELQYNSETKYILGEVSMSVYCTEILGYHTEIWERPLEPDMPDPLGILYSRHSDIVRTICGKDKLDRRLRFLNAR